ncbi:MAG: TIR domain-containing protein [Cyanobacteria bacterium P01_H01_bin.162]
MIDSPSSPERDFFISYTGPDRAWAEWIGWILEEAGHTVFIDVWDFRAGKNFALEMQKGTRCDKTIAVLSKAYLEADYTNPEWAAAFADDPKGEAQKLIPVRVEKFDPTGLLKSLVYVDLVDLPESEAERALLNAMRERGKPASRPSFPVSDQNNPVRSFLNRVWFPSSDTDEKSAEPSTASPDESDNAARPQDAESTHQNPFWPRKGGIEDPAQFFNCDEILNRIFETLNRGSSVALIGDNNTGKTSLLWTLFRLAPKRLQIPRQPVLLNLAKVFSEQDFYEDLCEELGMPAVYGNKFVRQLYRQKKQILLLLDEVERISQEEFTHKLRQELRGLAEGGDAPLRIVIAARTSLDQLFPESYVDGQTSPLEGITVEEHVTPWSDDTCSAFIAHRLGNGPIQFTPREMDQIIRKCDGNPQQLNQACYQLYTQYLAP